MELELSRLKWHVSKAPNPSLRVETGQRCFAIRSWGTSPIPSRRQMLKGLCLVVIALHA